MAFVALPQVPPGNPNRVSRGHWIRWAKVTFERYFPYEMRSGRTHSFYEGLVLFLLDIRKLEMSA